MKRLFSDSDQLFTSLPTSQREEWSAIVPAAGRGSRLGSASPKLLYSIAGRTILDRLLETLSTQVSNVVLVVAPGATSQIESELHRLKQAHAPRPSLVKLVQQTAPRGMADAVLQAEHAIMTANSIVIWGDQVTMQSSTLEMCQLLHESRQSALLTLPSFLKNNPYIEIVRDDDGRIVRIAQAREGEVHALHGESDCGAFCFQTKALFEILNTNTHHPKGARTGEYNLLPLLPLFERGHGSVATLRLENGIDAIGVNTAADAEAAEKVILARVYSKVLRHG